MSRHSYDELIHQSRCQISAYGAFQFPSSSHQHCQQGMLKNRSTHALVIKVLQPLKANQNWLFKRTIVQVAQKYVAKDCGCTMKSMPLFFCWSCCDKWMCFSWPQILPPSHIITFASNNDQFICFWAIVGRYNNRMCVLYALYTCSTWWPQSLPKNSMPLSMSGWLFSILKFPWP